MARGGDPFEITAQMLLRAYSIGMFPMAEDADDPTLFWVDPEQRGVFPLDGFLASKKLRRLVRADRFGVRIDADFEGVIAACAGGDAERPKTWINPQIRALYRELFRLGFAHTVEILDAEGALVGGLYGVQIGAAFFGESMFHRAPNASKVALTHLVARLRAAGFMLLDTQFLTSHLQSLGAVEMPREAYHRLLDAAIGASADFYHWPKNATITGAQALAALDA